MQQQAMMRQFLRGTGMLMLMINLVQIAVFVAQMLAGTAFEEGSALASQFVAIVLIFSLGAFLYRNAIISPDDRSASIMRAFSWIYIVVAALVQMKLAYTYMKVPALYAEEIVAHVFFIALCCGLSTIVMRSVHGDTVPLGMPFMVVFLFQAVLWVFMMLGGGGVSSQHIAQLLLMAYTMLIVAVFIRPTVWATMRSANAHAVTGGRSQPETIRSNEGAGSVQPWSESGENRIR